MLGRLLFPDSSGDFVSKGEFNNDTMHLPVYVNHYLIFGPYVYLA